MTSSRAKLLLKRSLAPVLYRHPTPSLRPERLYAYLDALWQRRELAGAVLEVGCFMGATAAVASTMLRNIGHPKRYVCIDAFAGFVNSHFERDVSHGLRRDWRLDFSANSRETVAHLLERWGSPEVELVEADIANMGESRIPEAVSVCLVDVDLEVPTYEGLRRVVPRLVPGGVVLVDDCAANESWPGPARGYRRFVEENGLAETYFMGMGIVTT